MRKAVIGLLLSAALAAPGLAAPNNEKAWLACQKTMECTAVEIGCYYWQPVSRKYAVAMQRKYPPVCFQTTEPGPMPPITCVNHRCTASKLHAPKAPVMQKKTAAMPVPHTPQIPAH